MPPKAAAKEKPQKGDEAEEENRPYSSTDVSTNLKGKVPKAAAQKIMQALSDKGTLTVKAYGKQTVFVYNQSLLPVLPASEMGDIDTAFKTAKDQAAAKSRVLKDMQTELLAMEAMPKTTELNGEIKRVKTENEVTLKTLLPYRGLSTGENGVKPMSSEETKKIDVEFDKWRKIWVERRKVYKELLGFFQDVGVTDVKQFEEDQGVTPDDADVLALEAGEFCMPPARPTIKRVAAKSALATKKTAPPRKSVVAVPVSQLSPTATSDSEDEDRPRKKARKV